MSQLEKIKPEVKEALTDSKSQVKPDKETPSDVNSENELKVSSTSDEGDEKLEVAEEPIFEMQVPMGFNLITAPKVCPPGHRLDSHGKCRKIV